MSPKRREQLGCCFVETVHRLEEDEFFDLEDFSSRGDFLAKVHTYQLYFNLARPNSHKENQSPWQILLWQTDNGGEFKGDFPRALGDSQHVRIPPAAHTYQSDHRAARSPLAARTLLASTRVSGLLPQ